MTLTQLGAFVLVAKLGSVRAAAVALGVSEPAVSQALTALRKQLGDELVVKDAAGMTLTPGGQRLLPIASQMVTLGTEAEAAVRAGQGAPARLRVVADSTVAEFVAPSLLEAFASRAGGIEASVGVASRAEMAVLLSSHLADVAIGPEIAGADANGIESRPIMRCRMIVVTGDEMPPGRWLLGPSATDPLSPPAALVERFGVLPEQVRVFPSEAAAWTAAAEGQGVAPAFAHLVSHELDSGRLREVDLAGVPSTVSWYISTLGPGRRSEGASALRQFVTTPQAMQLMHRPGRGVPPGRFRPPVYVTIWS